MNPCVNYLQAVLLFLTLDTILNNCLSNCWNLWSGKCDDCYNNTEGKNCEYCKAGHHRDSLLPTSDALVGCKACFCNGHSDNGGDYREVCDASTGDCVCDAFTEGETCHRCKVPYEGDPR